MEIVKASIMWPGLDVDVLTLFLEPTSEWVVDPLDDRIVLLRALDESGQETDAIVGVQIVGFLTFDRWADLPNPPVLWQLPGEEPLPLGALLQREQQALRSEVKAPSPSR